jgi:hypothetical protein
MKSAGGESMAFAEAADKRIRRNENLCFVTFVREFFE